MNKKADRILNATMKLLIRNGIAKITKITMDDIAESAVVSKVTIYKYFNDKDTLYLEASKRILSGCVSKMEGIVSSGDPLPKKLFCFLGVISDFIDNGQLILCSELARQNDRIDDELELYRQAYMRTVMMLIDEGLRDGLIKGNLDRDIVFHYIDMGVAYYQQNPEYRNRMLNDESFRRQYMLFYVSNLYADAEKFLSAQ
jgi:AcrR family transcriptional regulator